MGMNCIDNKSVKPSVSGFKHPDSNQHLASTKNQGENAPSVPFLMEQNY